MLKAQYQSTTTVIIDHCGLGAIKCHRATKAGGATMKPLNCKIKMYAVTLTLGRDNEVQFGPANCAGKSGDIAPFTAPDAAWWQGEIERQLCETAGLGGPRP